MPYWPVTLTEGPITLRPHRRSDNRAWREVRLANATWLGPWEPTSTVPWAFRHQPKDYRVLYRLLARGVRAGTILPFVIEYTGQFAGQLSIGNIVRGSACSGVAGYWLDQAVAGRNIAPTALAMATDFALGSAQLHRVEVNIRPENGASIRVVEKLGFRREGFHERLLHIDGAWRDHIGYALTVEDLPVGGLLRWWRGQQTT